MSRKRRNKRSVKSRNFNKEPVVEFDSSIKSYKKVKEEILQSIWHKNNWDVVYVGTSSESGEKTYIHYDGTPYLEKRNTIVSYMISDQFTIEEYSDWYKEIVVEIQQLINDINAGNIWEPEDEKVPEYVTYDFGYPNGKMGDIDYYIATEHGTVEKIDALTCRVKMSTRYKEQLAHLMLWYNGGAFDENFSERRYYEISSFLTTYNKAHKLRKLCDIFAKYGPFQYHPLREKGRDVAQEYIKTIRRKRHEIYSYLITQNRTSSRWVSEQKMYEIVREEFPNALYHYKAEWLGLQSIDVFIPDKKIGFEYQGIQHYEPVSLFGGDEGLIENQRRDREKKEKCELNSVKLIEWKYDLPINRENLVKLLEDTI